MSATLTSDMVFASVFADRPVVIGVRAFSMGWSLGSDARIWLGGRPIHFAVVAIAATHVFRRSESMLVSPTRAATASASVGFATDP